MVLFALPIGERLILFQKRILMPSISILHAPRDEAMGAKIAAALESAGHSPVRGSGAIDDDAAIVVWTEAAATLARLHEQAAAAMARGALIPVAVGGAAPPDGFEDLPPVDLSGWTGAPDDPRWRFVLEEIQLTEQRLNLRDGVVWASAEATRDDEPTSSADASAEERRAWRSFGDAAPAAPAAITAKKSRRGFSARQVAFGAAGGLVAMTIATALLAPIVLPAPSAPARQEIAAPASETEAVPDPSPQRPESLASLSVAGDVPFAEDMNAAPDDPVAEIAAADAAALDLAPIELPAGQPGAGEPDSDAMQNLIAAVSADAADIPDPGDPLPLDVIDKAYLGNYFKECVECPDMAAVPAGAFRMGAAKGESTRQTAETPQREVTIAKRFALGSREVTYAQWDACVADGGCKFAPSDHGWGRGQQPVTGVSYEDALSYVAWLSKKTGQPYRLPTEAEWEYAARAGSDKAFAFGDGVSVKQANFNGQFPYRGAKETFRGRTTPAASFAPNAFGLFDMHGNVWEWTADCWKASHAGAPADGSAVTGGDCGRRVLKGGAWNTGGWRLRAAHRIAKPKSAREFDNGFRVARDLG